jgi:hypothetical protein
MIMHNTRESAVRRDVFHEVLQAWLDDSFDASVGDVENHAGPAWLWVRHGGEHFYLHATATRSGVREYLRIVSGTDGEIEWDAATETAPTNGRVAIGPARTMIDGFELYRHLPRR